MADLKIQALNMKHSIEIKQCLSAGSRLDSNLIIMQNEDDTDLLNINLISELQLIKKRGCRKNSQKTFTQVIRNYR